MIECELLIIGNELLIGKITDTNGKWIIDTVVPLGVKVERMTIIPDDVKRISDEIRNAIKRSPDYVFTSGGLGPTFDDMTLEGISKGLPNSAPLVINEEALDFIKKRYKALYPQHSLEELLTPSRKKMAYLPLGSKPLKNREGTAPGVYIPKELTNGKTTIVAFPGIPKELKAIFMDHIYPELRQKSNTIFYEGGFIFLDLGESKFTEFVYEIKDRYPRIWIKTHPRSRKDKAVELHLTSYSSDSKVLLEMQELYERLKNHVLTTGGRIIKERPPQTTKKS